MGLGFLRLLAQLQEALRLFQFFAWLYGFRVSEKLRLFAWRVSEDLRPFLFFAWLYGFRVSEKLRFFFFARLGGSVVVFFSSGFRPQARQNRVLIYHTVRWRCARRLRQPSDTFYFIRATDFYKNCPYFTHILQNNCNLTNFISFIINKISIFWLNFLVKFFGSDCYGDLSWILFWQVKNSRFFFLSILAETISHPQSLSGCVCRIKGEQIIGTQDKSQCLVVQRPLSHLQYLVCTKSSTKDLSTAVVNLGIVDISRCRQLTNWWNQAREPISSHVRQRMVGSIS